MGSYRYIAYMMLILLLLIQTVQAPTANPYDCYDKDSYNCLDIAIDCQEWHEFNSINTTILIGLFNATHGHAWLIDTDTGNAIVGNTSRWPYVETKEYI